MLKFNFFLCFFGFIFCKFKSFFSSFILDIVKFNEIEFILKSNSLEVISLIENSITSSILFITYFNPTFLIFTQDFIFGIIISNSIFIKGILISIFNKFSLVILILLLIL